MSSQKATKVKVSKVRKGNQELFEIKRPIIFICNDIWTKALRPLKELAIQVKIEQADSKRLFDRLIHIRKREGVRMDDNILHDLIEKVNYDARSAITNLQFLSRKFQGSMISKKDLEESSMYSRNGGLKDSTISIFEATEQILFGKFTTYDNLGLLNRVKLIGSSFGDYRQLNDSLLENFSNCCHYSDDSFEKTAFFMDLLSRCDVMQSFVYKTQSYDMAFQF